jgi:hypothetical protein
VPDTSCQYWLKIYIFHRIGCLTPLHLVNNSLTRHSTYISIFICRSKGIINRALLIWCAFLDGIGRNGRSSKPSPGRIHIVRANINIHLSGWGLPTMIEAYLYYSISLYATIVSIRAAQFLIVINLLTACILS